MNDNCWSKCFRRAQKGLLIASPWIQYITTIISCFQWEHICYIHEWILEYRHIYIYIYVSIQLSWILVSTGASGPSMLNLMIMIPLIWWQNIHTLVVRTQHILFCGLKWLILRIAFTSLLIHSKEGDQIWSWNLVMMFLHTYIYTHTISFYTFLLARREETMLCVLSCQISS
jgi:hypothetical protein